MSFCLSVRNSIGEYEIFLPGIKDKYLKTPLANEYLLYDHFIRLFVGYAFQGI